MGGRWRAYLLLLFTAVSAEPLKFNITQTWDGQSIGSEKPVQLHLDRSPDGEFLEVSIIAPFYNDPPPSGSPGDASYIDWDEVVEAYFLNDDDQYFQLQLCPFGQHNAFLYNGSRERIRYLLPLMTTVQINRPTSTWTGLAKIPLDYLPSNVTKFNAFAMHGTRPNRAYWSLFPADSTLSEPNFHALQFFQEVDFSQVLPNLPEEASQLWVDALEGVFRYYIKTEWNSKPVSHEPVEIKLQGFEAGVEMNVSAPFFNDTKPDGPSGEPFYGLWDYEVVEMFFLNDNEEYLEVELGPWGQHLLLLLKGARQAIKHSMPLDYIAQLPSSTNGKWTGSAMIPPEYFPPNVSRINAYAIHGTGNERVYESLYPAPENDPEYPQADFHRLELFKAVDFEYQMNDNSEYSQLWLDAMDSSGSSSTDISPVVKNEEEVEITTSLFFRDDEEVLVTTLAPVLRESERDEEPSRRRTPHPHKVEPQESSRKQRLEVEQSDFRQRPQPSIVPRPQRVRGTASASGLFRDRILDPVDQQFQQGIGSFQDQGVGFEKPEFQDPRFSPREPEFQNPRFPPREPEFQDPSFPPREPEFQDSRFPPRQPAFEDPNFPPREPAFQDPSFQPREPAFQDPNFPPREPVFQDQGRPQSLFQEEERQPFVGQGQQQFQNLPPVQNQREQLFQTPSPFQEPQQQQFETLPQTTFQEEQPRPFQNQGQQQFLPPQPSREQEREQFVQGNRAPQDSFSSVPGTQSSQVFNPPLVRQDEQVVPPEVEAAIQTLSQDLAALPPPHPVCFEPGLVPDRDRCYAFHECVLEDGEWQMYSWRCRRGQIYDPVNVACRRGRCANRKRGG